MADRLFDQLEESYYGESCVIHSNKTQNYRLRSIEQFRNGENRILIATDVMARGLDIDNVSHVINFDTPEYPENYMHRIGRTGRAGAKGEAISLVSADETSYLKGIEKLIAQKIPVDIIEGFEPDPNIRRKDIDDTKLKSEHKKPEKKRERQYNKNTSKHAQSKTSKKRRRKIPKNKLSIKFLNLNL